MSLTDPNGTSPSSGGSGNGTVTLAMVHAAAAQVADDRQSVSRDEASVSWVVDNPAAQRFTITDGDGVDREPYQLTGELNGKPGVYEWIVDRSGSEPLVTHQRFRPGGSVTGGPNQ